MSLSYEFGYSNRAALALVAVGILLVLALGPSLQMQDGQQPAPLSTRTIALASACTALLCLAFYLLTRRVNGYDESIYLIDRIWHVANGQRPYIDFEYAYGAFFLYAPAALMRWLRLPIGDAYGLCWILSSVAGVLMLAQVLRWSAPKWPRANVIFLILWGSSLPGLLSNGLNYTLLRFVTPCFFGLLALRILRRDHGSHWGQTTLVAACGTAVMLVLSPELAIACAIGSLAFFCWDAFLSDKRRGLPWCALLLLLNAALISLANRLHALDTLKAFSKGGMNFPISLNVYTVLFLAIVTVATCYAATRLRQSSPDSWMMILAVSFPALPAALGRCDSLHLWNNTYGIVLVGLLVLAGYPRIWRLMLPVNLLIIVVLPSLLYLRKQPSNIGKVVILSRLAQEPIDSSTAFDRWTLKRMTKELGPEKAKQKLAMYRDLSHTTTFAPDAIFHLAPGQTVLAPQTYAPSRFGTSHAPELYDGYFFGTLNAVTEEEINRKIGELVAHPDAPLLIMPEQMAPCTVSEPEAQQLMQMLFLTHYRASIRHTDAPELRLCRYIDSHYELAETATPEQFGYAVWKPRHRS
ncbi:MAG: hypothetical protein PW792_03180 [Acidobacteriaceae bacterium]|nr:hypothetical protein [Acidobacteriaceae bacterium]